MNYGYELIETGVVLDENVGGHLPCVAKALDGSIVVQFNTGVDGYPGSIGYVIKSYDGGRTWRYPIKKILENSSSNGAIHTNIGLTTFSNGNMILPFSKAELKNGYLGFPNPFHSGYADSDVHVILSSDNGNTWGPWISANGNTSGQNPCSSAFGRVVEFPDGRLILPMWAFWNWFTLDSHPAPTYSGFVISTDMGQTFGPFQWVGDYGEMSLLLLSDQQTLLGVCKKNNAPSSPRIIKSTDMGQTWIEINTNFQGSRKNASLHLSPHGVAMLLSSQTGEAIGGSSIIEISQDEGLTWEGAFTVKAPVYDPGRSSYGLSAVNLDNEKILIVDEAHDPRKIEYGGSPWTSTRTYLAYNIVKELVLL